MCVGLCDKDASLRDMDVVLAAMLVPVCVHAVLVYVVKLMTTSFAKYSLA